MYFNFKNIIIWVLSVFFAMKCVYAQDSNIPPTIVATGNQSYCPLSDMNIVTDFDIIDPDDSSIEALYIQISTGYEFSGVVATHIPKSLVPSLITCMQAESTKTPNCSI